MTATATPAPPRRAALGHFLKAQPRAAEPRGCVGVTWYTWLEQGRAINVSDQVLDAVALWCCFAEPGGRDKFVNDAEEVRHLVARLRAEYAAHIGDPEWEEDIRRLAERSPEFAELWARHEVAAPAERVRQFRHPQVGLLTLVNTELAVPPEGLRMSVYTPRDAETRHRLTLIRSREPLIARVG